MGKRTSSWPTLSGPNSDGSRHVGLRVLPDARDQLQAQGFVVANKMFERSVDRAVVTSVRIGDVLDVRFDGDRAWWVWRDDVRLGKLTWSPGIFEQKAWQEAPVPRIDDGTMQVIRLILDGDGRVTNAGGIVRPRGVKVPRLEDAVPYAEVYTPTLRATVSESGVSVQAENIPGAPRVGSPPSNPEQIHWPKKSFLARLLGR